MSRMQTIVNASVARALIKAMGMQAENLQRQHLGESVTYPDSAFVALIDDEGIGWNTVIELLNQEPTP